MPGRIIDIKEVICTIKFEFFQVGIQIKACMTDGSPVSFAQGKAGLSNSLSNWLHSQISLAIRKLESPFL